MKTALWVLIAVLGFFATTVMADEPLNHRNSVYVLFGDGKANQGGGSLAHRAGQYGLDIPYTESTFWRLLYNNEGTPEQVGHRDGFAGMLVLPLYNGKFDILWGFGPYFSMNTVGKGNGQVNQKGVGLMNTFSLKYPISKETSFIAAINDVSNVHGQFSSTALLLGLAYDFSPKKSGDSSSGASAELRDAKKYQASIWVGNSKTTRTEGIARATYQVEILKPSSESNTALSVSVISEGADKISDRKGIAAQGWYRARAGEAVEFSAGLGPYIARESNKENAGWQGLIIISTRVTAKITDKLSVGAQFNRLASSYNKDQDMVGLSLAEAF